MGDADLIEHLSAQPTEQKVEKPAAQMQPNVMAKSHALEIAAGR